MSEEPNRSPAPEGQDAPETRTESPEQEAGFEAASVWERQFKYLLADFENFRKRAERERTSFRRDVEAEFLRRLIPLFEAFDRARGAVQHLSPSDPLRRGLDLVGREWEAFLEQFGFRAVARVGETFRPDEHEAVGEVPSGHSNPDGSIAEIVQQGYRFEGGLLRPAKVIVARTPAEGSGPVPSEKPVGRNATSESSEESSA